MRTPLGPRARSLIPVLACVIDVTLCLTNGGRFSVVTPLVAAAACATLYARYRYPLVVLALHLGWSAWSTAEWQSRPVAGLLVALYAVAAGRPVRLSVPGAALTAAALCGQLGLSTKPPHDGLFGVLVAAVVAGGTWGLGRRNITMRAEAAAAALRVERLRIARELHDIVSHALSGIVVQAAGAQAVLVADPSLAARALTTIEGTGAQAMDEMHRMLGLLRSADGDDPPRLDRQPGLEDIGTLLDWARDNGLTPTTVVDGEPRRLDDSTSLTAYRIVQEALTNTLKHAGPGTAVTIRLGWGDADLTICVEDHAGRSPRTGSRSPRGGGYGLTGLRERASTVGGTFCSEALDQGFMVSATLPVARHDKRVEATVR